MPLPQTGFFDAARVTGIMNAQVDPRLQPQPLIWNARVPDVPSYDYEITAKYRGSLLIADLIADDAKAVVYSQGRFQFESYAVPNIKMGLSMNQAMIAEMNRLSAMNFEGDDGNIFKDRYSQNIADVKYGVNLRKEVLKLAMLLDGYNYDRLGIKAANVTWGMYPDLKVADADWTNTGTTGLTTITNTRQLAKARYGISLNRGTCSTAALRALVKQTEYQSQVKLISAMTILSSVGPVAPLQTDAMLVKYAETIITGMGEPFTIEIDDRRYESQDNAGAITQNRFHPLNKFLLTSTANDRNRSAYDFADCMVVESGLVNAGFPNSVLGSIPMQRGPVGYVTLADPSLNAPGVVTWGVARGFPRKHQDQSSAVIDVGPSLSETFSTSVPNPL